MEMQKNKKNLHKKYLWMILECFIEKSLKLPNCVNIGIDNDKELTVCGDTHG
jgi:hypothetical protein